MLKVLAPLLLKHLTSVEHKYTSTESDCEESLAVKSEYKSLATTLMYLNVLMFQICCSIITFK